MEDITLVNRVAESGIITLNLEEMICKDVIVVFDLKDYLFHGLILKEKDFRDDLKNLDWTPYLSKIVLIQCSTDAIIPMWAYMLVATYLVDKAKDVYHGTADEYQSLYLRQKIDALDLSIYEDKRVVIKGCSDVPVPVNGYVHITQKLKPYAQSIMYGEPCSTVPIAKRPRKLS